MLSDILFVSVVSEAKGMSNNAHICTTLPCPVPGPADVYGCGGLHPARAGRYLHPRVQDGRGLRSAGRRVYGQPVPQRIPLWTPHIAHPARSERLDKVDDSLLSLRLL